MEELWTINIGSFAKYHADMWLMKAVYARSQDTLRFDGSWSRNNATYEQIDCEKKICNAYTEAIVVISSKKKNQKASITASSKVHKAIHADA